MLNSILERVTRAVERSIFDGRLFIIERGVLLPNMFVPGMLAPSNICSPINYR